SLALPGAVAVAAHSVDTLTRRALRIAGARSPRIFERLAKPRREVAEVARSALHVRRAAAALRADANAGCTTGRSGCRTRARAAERCRRHLVAGRVARGCAAQHRTVRNDTRERIDAVARSFADRIRSGARRSGAHRIAEDRRTDPLKSDEIARFAL